MNRCPCAHPPSRHGMPSVAKVSIASGSNRPPHSGVRSVSRPATCPARLNHSTHHGLVISLVVVRLRLPFESKLGVLGLIALVERLGGEPRWRSRRPEGAMLDPRRGRSGDRFRLGWVAPLPPHVVGARLRGGTGAQAACGARETTGEGTGAWPSACPSENQGRLTSEGALQSYN